MFICICACDGCLKYQRVLVSATSMIGRNFSDILYIKQNVILPPFLESHFNSARMPVKLPSSKV